MASTLLAVEDSVTMRKVLEITFAGPDFRVLTAQGPDVALQKLKSDKPDLVIADVTLDGKNGYELCKAIKQASPATPVLILSSKQNPFDAARGSAAQADDHMDKPFDTQQMIDKVKKLLAARGEAKPAAAAPAVAAAPAAAAAPVAAPAPAAARPGVQPAAPAPVAAAPAAAQRAKTLLYNPPPAGSPAALAEAARAAEPAKPIVAPAAAAKPAAAAPAAAKPEVAPTPATGIAFPQRSAAATTMASMPAATPPQPAAPAPAPAPAPAAAPAPAPAAAAAAVTAQVNGQMASKLEEIGLTPAQVEAVLALSRDVIERVAWEVVPVLAETIIKEEIARLTK